ncbi:MAG TPA: hypothetical protein VFR68_14525 [Candidatus Dormibacteraeota bacterium]|nr:hypothetical protein [Candidatus Dormibacteraeota bacterium]
MIFPVEDTRLRLQALVYVIKLYDELTAENGASTLGTQNQAVDFILANPERRRAGAEWATSINIDERGNRRNPLYRNTSTIIAEIARTRQASRRSRSLR